MDIAKPCSSIEVFARALFDFDPTVKEELKLKIGYILKILNQVDKFWFYGQNLHNGCIGQFPKDFVDILTLPPLKNNETLLFALDPFYAEVKDDLPFQKGDLIILTRKVDNSWGCGRCNNKHGIFPLNYTQRLVTSPSGPPKLSKHIDVNSVICTVKATMPLTAQIEGELSFDVGDNIAVTEIMSDNWAHGQIGDASGTFPLFFTTYAENTSIQNNPALMLQSQDDRKKDSTACSENTSLVMLNSQKTLQRNCSNHLPHTSTSCSTISILNSVHREAHSKEKLNNEPSNPLIDQTHSDSKSSAKLNGAKSHNCEDDAEKNVEDDQNTYVIANFSYKGRNAEELSFCEGDIIEVVEKRSEMWLYGKVNGLFGYVPRTYVTDFRSNSVKKLSTANTKSDEELLLDQGEAVTRSSTNVNKEVNNDLSHLPNKQVDTRLVVTDFQAITDFELTVCVGDIVHLVEQVNQDWCKVENSSRKRGFVPTTCLQLTNFKSSLRSSSTLASQTNDYSTTNKSDQSQVKSFFQTEKSSLATASSSSASNNIITERRHSTHQQKHTAIKQFKRSKSEKFIKKEKAKFVNTGSTSELNPNNHKGSLSADQQHSNCYLANQTDADSLSTASFDSSKSYSHSSNSSSKISFSDSNSSLTNTSNGLNTNLVSTEENKPPVPLRTTSHRRVNRTAPPPPTSLPHGNKKPSSAKLEKLQTNITCDSIVKKPDIKIAPKRPVRPPQPRNLSALKTVQTIETKQKAVEHKMKIEKVRSEIEEYCRTQKELQNLYNNTLDGKERQGISENRQFVDAKLRRLQSELGLLINDADHIYETFDGSPLDADETLVSPIVPPQPPPVDSIAEVKEKRINKRYHVIKEIISTEQDYLQDLAVTIDDIMKPLINHQPSLDVNLDTLFGNIEDIRDFSAQLYLSLKEANQKYSIGEINIGEIFILHIPRMKEVYKLYCRNHDDATALLEKYEQEETDFQVAVQKCLDDVKNKVNTFDLGSFLIKPVQRILKYPLLLQELLKLTDIPQPDTPSASYNSLLQAVKLMQEVANDINEDKRRKDLVRKYRKTGQEGTLSGKISKISLHSVKKKGARISVRLGHVTGLNQPETVDENFNAVEQRFKDLEKAVKNFLQNSDNHLIRCRDFLNVEYVVSEHLNELVASDRSPLLTSHGLAMRRISEQLYRQFHDRTKLRVHTPLLAMLDRSKAPQSLIGKRFDKLLDYESCQKNSDSKEKTQMARNVYEALNQQLLDELPKLCELGYKLVQTCIGIYINLQIQFHSDIRKELLPVLDQCSQVPAHDDAYKTKIMEIFNSSHNQALYAMRHFTIIPSQFCAFLPSSQPSVKKSDPPRSRSHSVVSQTASQRQELMSKYKKEDLFIARANHSSLDKISISCAVNDVIAVIKRQNPLGNTDTWFCDNGAAKGFLPSNILQPINIDPIVQSPIAQKSLLSPGSPGSVHASSSLPTTGNVLSPPVSAMKTSPTTSPYSVRQGLYSNTDAPNTEHIYDDVDVFQEEDEMLDDTEYGECGNTSKGHFRVEFSFHASTDLELSVEEGDIVTLIVPHDLEGNSEWWLMVDSRGNQGYVPANYMSRAEYL